MTISKQDLNTNLKGEARKLLPENAKFKNSATAAIDDRYLKKSTLIGQVDGEVLGGIKSIGEVAGSPEEVIQSAVGLLTDKIPSLSGIKKPNISQNGTTVTSLTGLPAIKCNNPNSGMEAVSDGTPQSIAECASLVESKTAESLKEISAFTEIIEAQNATGLGGGGGFFGKISAAFSVLKIADMLPSVEALAPVRELNANIKAVGDRITDAVKNATGIEGLTAGGVEFKNGLPTIDSLKQALPEGLRDVVTKVDNFVDDVEEFANEFEQRTGEGLGGVLQNLTEGLGGDASSFLNNLVPGGLSLTEQERRSILEEFSLGDATDKVNAIKKLTNKSPNVSAEMKSVIEDAKDVGNTSDLNNNIVNEARRRGIPEKEILAASSEIATIDNSMAELDTTVSGSVVIDADLFDESIPVDENNQKWDGRNSSDDTFTYVSSVEELDAEFSSIKRDITEVVVHATETYTNKDIGSIEINNIQIDLGHDGIGYHYVIRRDGRLQRGRPVNRAGEHAIVNGHDKYSIGLVMVGGINVSSGDDNPTDYKSSQSFTREQYTTLEKFLTSFYRKYPGGQVFGHNDVDENELDPYFDVVDYIESVFRKQNTLDDASANGPLSPSEINNDN